MKRYAVPTLTTAIGLAWLLGSIGVLPSVAWPWTLGLAAAGILCFLFLGVNKLTFVVGTFLLVCSLFSLLRQMGIIGLNIELPLLVVAFGLLLLLAESLKLPGPDWVVEPGKEEETARKSSGTGEI